MSNTMGANSGTGNVYPSAPPNSFRFTGVCVAKYFVFYAVL